MADAFGIGVSALTGLQQALKTTGQNIANVNTEGYSRQFVEFGTRPPQLQFGSFVGSGVDVTAIRRSFDQFLTQDLQARTASASFFANLSETAGRVDELFGDPTTGIGPAVTEFFASMEAVANSPTTLPERQVMIAQAETLAQRFQSFDRRLSEFQFELNVKVETAASDINQFAEVIAELNEQISLQSAQTGGNPAGDLLDKRDQAITQLSALVRTTPQPQDDGAINVFIGRGQPLVIGSSANALVVEPDDLLPNRLAVFVEVGAGQRSEVTTLLEGGEIGAALTAAEDVIERVRRDVGVLAAGLTIRFNQLHREGYALDGVTTGVNFFSPLAGDPPDPSQVLGVGTASLTAVIDDPADPSDDANVGLLSGDSYRLDYAAGALQVTNVTTGAQQTFAIPAATTDFELVIDGVTVTIDDTDSLANGDRFLLAPTATAAANFGVNIADPNQVAAALDANSPGDARNLQAMIALQDEPTLIGGASFEQFYTNTTSSIAVQTRRATSLAETEASLLASAQARQSNVAGVNLEEEAANLIRFQQAFQAAAQIIAAARDAFDTIIRATE